MAVEILIVEDEVDILELLEYTLAKEGYEVVGCTSTSNVEKILQDGSTDLLIMDRNLPGVEGSEFVASLRKKGVTTPVIFLTAKVEDHHKLEGFNRGGDDYITKPFNIQELLARVGAMIRRTKHQSPTLSYRDIVIDFDQHTVAIDGSNVELTKREFDLLVVMIKNKNIVLTRETLLEQVWSDEDFLQERTVDVAVKRLKEKIDPSKKKDYIASVRGVGYKLC